MKKSVFFKSLILFLVIISGCKSVAMLSDEWRQPNAEECGRYSVSFVDAVSNGMNLATESPQSGGIIERSYERLEGITTFARHLIDALDNRNIGATRIQIAENTIIRPGDILLGTTIGNFPHWRVATAPNRPVDSQGRYNGEWYDPLQGSLTAGTMPGVGIGSVVVRLANPLPSQNIPQ